MSAEPIEETIRKFALQNAAFFKGKANPKAVVGKVLGGFPEYRSKTAEITQLINSIVAEVNALSPEAQKEELAKTAPELLVKEKKERTYELPDLAGAEKGHTVMRIAPGPSGPLHIGHTRVSILNDEYTKRYGGQLILRFEDTNPEKIDPEAYDMIPEDLAWLGVKCTKTYTQSDRFEIYYDYTRRLIEMGKAYVCTCNGEKWRDLKEHKLACPCRDLPVEEQMERYDRMMSGGYEAGKAIAVVKTDIAHPNPAIRDFVALRLVDTPHPRTGDKYRAYPMMNLSVAVDDHLMGMTHVIRGKDHLNNTLRQKYIFDYFGWKQPEYIHYGLVNIPDTVLKTSLIKQSIQKGEYSGWDDVRTGTVRALERRGIRPEAIRRYWIESGIKSVDIQFSWDGLYSMNRDIIDPVSDRYFFVQDPVRYDIEGTDAIVGQAPLQPDHADRGFRFYRLDGPKTVFITEKDSRAFAQNKEVRLKDLCNLTYGTPAQYAGNDTAVLKKGVHAVQWVSRNSVPAEVLMPDGTVARGLVEETILHEPSNTVQFERFGFVKLEQKTSEKVTAVYTHN
ncbi:MAG: glutamate--tRNA ligase [Candidatus Methanomethylophilus sp.]|nr:glutamate--tRNA ligase [Methanomethylophilus sp.]